MDAKVTQNSSIFNALGRVMRPLVRLMLSKGITYVQLTEWLKYIFVETAVKDFALPEKVTNDSRISILTGVHRKDVRRLREELDGAAKSIEPSNVNLGSQIVSMWLSNPLYTENYVPKVIPRLKKQGGAISFEALVELVTKDVRARAILDELERLGAVNINDEDMVSLVAEAFIPSKGEDEKAYYLGLGVGDHAAAATYNVVNSQSPYFDRVVHYNNLPAEAVKEIERISREQGNLLLQQINNQAEKLESGHIQTSTKRFTMGVYFYSEDDAS